MDRNTIADALGALRLSKKAETGDEDKGPGAAQFFGMLFAARDRLHLEHLAAKSYAQHIALNEIYDSILGLTDGLVESYQGIHGLIKIDVPASSVSEEGAIAFLHGLYGRIDEQRKKFAESWIQNQIDELSTAVSVAIYKLENLK